ncbi:hypothetical protein [Streptomyces sp. NPDC088789]|uniref:hypothetical protein n=1 Tax=Streptomyces sp. NPDC088789 TaxID=3365899 RepID=UPI0038229DE4
MPDDEERIRTLITRWVDAVHRGDLEAVTAHHVPARLNAVTAATDAVTALSRPAVPCTTLTAPRTTPQVHEVHPLWPVVPASNGP